MMDCSPKTCTEDFFNFSLDQINYSFSHDFNQTISNTSECFFNEIETSTNLDLVEYKNFSNENIQSCVNNTLLESYFGQKCSENLELFDLDSKIFNNTSIVLNEINQTEATKTSKFEFSIPCYSTFKFDFLNFESKYDTDLKIHFKFVIEEKTRQFLFKIEQKSLTLHPKISCSENIASFTPYECGKYLIIIHVLPSDQKFKDICNPIIIETILNVSEINIRPLFKNDLIEINLLINDQISFYNFFFKMVNQHFDRSFLLKLCIDTQCEVVTFEKNIVNCNSKIKYHILNPWTCLVYFYNFSDFSVRLKLKPPQQVVDSFRSSLSIYMCDSIEENKSFLLTHFDTKIHFRKPFELKDLPLQVALQDGNYEIILAKWKRIDFRNGHSVQHVKVNIRLNYCGYKVDEADWKCTQSQFILMPFAKQTVFICLNTSVLRNSKYKIDCNRSIANNNLIYQPKHVQVCIDQFGGIGQQINSVMHFTLVVDQEMNKKRLVLK